VSELPVPVRGLLERGRFCHVAAVTPLGPHVTPMVFAVAGGRIWVTTSRGSVKARAWRTDPRAAGLVRAGADSAMFVGTARTHDVLEPSTWPGAIASAPLLAVATTRFTRKNARFFAGYAVDARRVPLAWTPPGRVFVELTVERAALIEAGRPPRVWGEWGDDRPSATRFRARRSGEGPFARLPDEVRESLGDGGLGALALADGGGPVVVPADWTVDGAGLYAAVEEETLALASLASPELPAALGVDRPSSWRARDMMGAMARGVAEVHAVRRLASGGASARSIASAAGVQGDVALVRIRPERFVWWRGWDSGTVVLG
jgi:nitroimidazol reductase NimA-like FMN-containing flavoprotein (pyridoxamine 5'-phosphate oxidase superfamily)